MRYCKSCGSELPEGAVFCPSCGRNVQDDGQPYGNNGACNYGADYRRNGNFNGMNYYYNDRYSALTILGFIFAFLSSLVGLILSIFAYNEAKSCGSVKNQNLSKAGIILSSVLLGLEIILVITIFILAIAGVITGFYYFW